MEISELRFCKNCQGRIDCRLFDDILVARPGILEFRFKLTGGSMTSCDHWRHEVSQTTSWPGEIDLSRSFAPSSSWPWGMRGRRRGSRQTPFDREIRGGRAGGLIIGLSNFPCEQLEKTQLEIGPGHNPVDGVTSFRSMCCTSE